MTTERRNAVLTAQSKEFIIEHHKEYTRGELAELCKVSQQVIGAFVRHHRIECKPYVRRSGYTVVNNRHDFSWVYPKLEQYFKIK